MDALPQTGSDGFQGLDGFGQPWDLAIYDAKATESKREQLFFCNVFWQNMHTSVLHFVPLYRERVIEYVDSALPTPGLPKMACTVLSNFGAGDSIPNGILIRVSPCEPIHVVLYRVAERLRANAPDSVLQGWLRVLVSYPIAFLKLDTEDDRYAEADSLRMDWSSGAGTVVLTTRQFCYNIQLHVD